MRWIIRGWPGPSADGMGPRLALNTARPSTDPRLAPNSTGARYFSIPSSDGGLCFSPHRAHLGVAEHLANVALPTAAATESIGSDLLMDLSVVSAAEVPQSTFSKTIEVCVLQNRRNHQ